MWELVKSGGWMMLPIILSSVAALGIIVERLWTLRASRVTPPHLLGQVWVWIKDKQLDKDKLKQLRADSPLGEILAAGLANSRHGREIMKECIEEAAARVIHELERYLNALGIIVERLWTLRASRVTPEHLLGQVWVWIKDKQMDKEKLKQLRADSPLGEILAAGLANSRHGREIMKECIEEAAARVIHELERYLNTLGTIAAMAPLLGLLGTVLGMIDIFSSFMGSGMTSNAAVLAGGISKALITTAAGLMVGIPAVFFHRFLQRRVDDLVVGMEQEAIKLVEVVQGDREVDMVGSKA